MGGSEVVMGRFGLGWALVVILQVVGNLYMGAVAFRAFVYSFVLDVKRYIAAKTGLFRQLNIAESYQTYWVEAVALALGRGLEALTI